MLVQLRRLRAASLIATLAVATAACSDSSDPEPEPNEPGPNLPELGFNGQDARFGEVNEEQLQRMVDVEVDGPFYMLNLIKFREQADYIDGRETDLTGREADALYAPLEFLEAIGAAPVFISEVETNLPLGDGTQWDRVAIVRYPSRALFLEMAQDPDFRARAIHKEAGVEKTIVMVSDLIELPLPDNFEPAEPAFPPTADDPPFDMVHILNYRDVAQYEPGANEPERSGREAVELYQSNAGAVATPMGVYPAAWFDIEGVLIGDGREWEELRINRFPSHATFGALTSDPTWAEGTHHRTAGIEDTYSLQTLPLLNTFAR